MYTMRKTLFIIAAVILIISLTACNNTQNEEQSLTTGTPAVEKIPETTAVPTPTPAVTPIPTTTPALTPQITFIGKIVCTADEFVNIRKDPIKDAEVIGQFPASKTADVLEYAGDWVKISYEGLVGFVYNSYTYNLRFPSVSVPVGDWAAILVNPTNLLPGDFEVELADFEGGKVDARILEIAEDMFADAKEDGVDLMLVDAYRSYDTQAEQYEAKVQKYINKGYSRADAEVKAATITARPNTSEHQTGLALDIVTPSYQKRNSGFAETGAFKWLSANAHNYGFIMRYPKGKEDITKVIYESWHWRFVGVQAAAEMKESGECYEEYLNILD